MVSLMSRILLAATIMLGLFSFVLLSPANATSDYAVISVPYNPADTFIPHPAYNGHPTTFKAICRGRDITSGTLVYFRWDINGDGIWDTGIGRTFAFNNGNYAWYSDSAANLDIQQVLPYVDPSVSPRKLFIATIEATLSISSSGEPVDPKFSTYTVMVSADVPMVDYSTPTPDSLISLPLNN